MQLDYAGDYFHLLETVGPVDIKLLRRGQEVNSAKAMEYGYWTRPTDGFTSIELTSGTNQTIKVAIAHGEGGYDRTTGSVSLLNQQGAFTHSQSSVTNADSMVKAANLIRRYLLVQNNSLTAVARVKTDGNAASATSGIRLQPGQSYEPQGYVPTGAIHVFMETADATANNIEVIEG